MPCHLSKQKMLLGGAGGSSWQIVIIPVSLIATRMLRRKLDEMTADAKVDQHEAMLAQYRERAPTRSASCVHGRLVCHIVENDYLNATTISLDRGIRLGTQ
jgi:hypothetical protein